MGEIVKKFKILIIHDIHVDTPQGRLEWAYSRRSAALQKYAPEDMKIDRCQTSEIPWGNISNYDLVFNLDYTNPARSRFKQESPDTVLCVSYNSDSNRRLERWSTAYTQADYLIVNNEDMYSFKGRVPNSCCIANGVDTNIFKPTTPISEREHRIFWRGSSNPRKGKGWLEVIKPAIPLLEKEGFICDMSPIDDIESGTTLTQEELVKLYNQCSYVMIASLAEGTPNIILEGVACGCVAVSTPVGNILEWGKHCENCVLSSRNVESFVECFKYARVKREELSVAGAKEMHDNWSYGDGERAQYFYQLWRRLIVDGVDSVDPFYYRDIEWSNI